MAQLPNDQPMAGSMDRYSRQIRFAGWGEKAQAAISSRSAVVVGCGALGTSIAEILVRAGVGTVRMIDRDYVEWNNLQRQALFDENDARTGAPKAEAAAQRLRAINSTIQIESDIADLHAGNVDTLCADADVLFDGTDNFETRYLVNDFAVKTGVPWVYGGVLGGGGICMPVLPGKTPCLRCVFDAPPPPEDSPSCETAGVMGSGVRVVAAIQAQEGLKILAGLYDDVIDRLLNLEVWHGDFRALRTSKGGPNPNCSCCGKRVFKYLEASSSGHSAALCGRDAVHIRPGTSIDINLDAMEKKLIAGGVSILTANAFLVRFRVEGLEVTLFRDGRAIAKGTSSTETARSMYARFVGI